MRVFPKWKGDLIDRLVYNQQAIKLHSKFKNGINVTVNDQLIYIGDDRKGIVPFGIHFSFTDFQIIQEYLERNQFEMSLQGTYIQCTDLQIDFSNCREYAATIRKVNNRQALEQMVDSVPLFLSYTTNTGLDFETILHEERSRMNFIYSNKTKDIQTFLTYFIGRGVGLTPSGDDFTIGLLAMNEVCSLLPSQFSVELLDFLQEDCTTDVSKAYLRAAAKGKYSSLVKNVLHSFATDNELALATHLLQLENSGSTSGRDTIAGMAVALQYGIEKGKKNEKTCGFGSGRKCNFTTRSNWNV